MRHFHVWLAFFITVGFFSFNPQSQAALSDPLTTIELDTPVHFLAPDGSDLVVEAGTYAIEPAKEWIRLMSGERHDALLIEAKQGSHELDIEDPLALSIPGTAGGQADNHYVMLLLPGGQSLEATGTYSGIRPRGLFDQAVKGFNRAKRDANRAYRQARSTVKKTQRSAQKGMSRAQKDMQRAQRQAAAKAEKNIRAARRAALQAKNQVERAAKQMADTATCLFANNKEARGLKVGGTVTVRIFAKKMCNDTKIMVLTGHKYSFEANGKWTDLDNTCDADGYPSPNTLLRASEGLRRMPGANWFALICAVNADKKLLFPIGTRRTMSMPRSGRLACFANDVATMYGNNKGEVKLTVTRVD